MYNQKPLSGDLIDYGHPLSQGLAGLWLFNEGSGGIVQDLSDNGHTGILQSTTSWAPGKFGLAPILNGTSDYITLGNLGLHGTSQITKIIWFKTTDTASVLIDNEHGGGHDCGMWLEAAPGLVARVEFSGGRDDLTITTFAAAGNGQWHQAGFTYDGTTFRGYFDGLPSGTPNSTMAGETLLHDFVTIVGRRVDTASSYLAGMIDLPIIYNRALASSEIESIYREPFCIVRTKRRRIIYDEIAGVPPGSFPYYYREIASRRIA